MNFYYISVMSSNKNLNGMVHKDIEARIKLFDMIYKNDIFHQVLEMVV